MNLRLLGDLGRENMPLSDVSFFEETSDWRIRAYASVTPEHAALMQVIERLVLVHVKQQVDGTVPVHVLCGAQGRRVECQPAALNDTPKSQWKQQLGFGVLLLLMAVGVTAAFLRVIGF